MWRVSECPKRKGINLGDFTIDSVMVSEKVVVVIVVVVVVVVVVVHHMRTRLGLDISNSS